MASYHEKGSDIGSQDRVPANSGYVLDSRRRAALAEVDNAKFSYVPEFPPILDRSHPRLLVGSMPKSVSLPASASSPMRELF